MRRKTKTPFAAKAALSGALAAASAVVCASCVTEPDPGVVVEVPADLIRFIEDPTRLDADTVAIQTLRQFRGEIVPVSDRREHIKSITADRISLTNRSDFPAASPVSLSFRNLHVRARKRIEVRFSDLSLSQQDPRDAIIVLVVADGVAHMEGPGYELTAPRIVIRNGEARAFGEDGQPWDLPPALRR